MSNLSDSDPNSVTSPEQRTKGWTDNAHHIMADSSLTDGHIRVLKHGDTFAVFDQYGNVRTSKAGEDGVYHDGTRFVSCLVLELEGVPPFLLSSTIRDDNDQLSVALTNPDLLSHNGLSLPLGSLHISRRCFLWQATCYQQITVESYWREPLSVTLAVRFGADFADIFEIRGMARKARGEDLAPSVDGAVVVLRYRGLDHVERSTTFDFSPAASVRGGQASYTLHLNPREPQRIHISAAYQRGHAGNSTVSRPFSYEEARQRAGAEIASWKATACRIQSSNGQFSAWVNRALSDLHMMTSVLPTGFYPYAGVPWFNTPFGRDGLVTAFECLWFWPELAKGVLAYLAHNQATEVVPYQDAEPGKILHETRNGEMAALREMPFGRYYGSVDATPLFVVLAGAYYERTGDLDFIRSIWSNVQLALHWMEVHGDVDGDGFIEYQRRSSDGLIHQGWKDADDAVFHRNGEMAVGTIALAEVQGYAFGAWQAVEVLAHALHLDKQAETARKRAMRLKHRFAQSFWSERMCSFALALDGEKRLCDVGTSNAGQCLLFGIASEEHAAGVRQILLKPEFFSGWGVRTVAEGEERYNPMGYHTGSVWPHDNALIAYGLHRYGYRDEVLTILEGLFEASRYFDLNRMPELFCGFRREEGEGPVLYPVACSPQSWAAASVFLLVQAMLGLNVDGVAKRISFVRPALPSFLTYLEITNLRIHEASVDILVARHGEDVSVKVLRRSGPVDVTVLP
jgi:glycogen debranching enzyme